MKEKGIIGDHMTQDRVQEREAGATLPEPAQNPDQEYEVRMGRMEIVSVSGHLAELRRAADQAGVRIICMNAEMMSGRRHAEEAIRQALRAEEEGSMTARSLEMEVLLYASGQRQTSIAMGFGLHEGGMLAWIGMVHPSEEAWTMIGDLIRPCPDENEVPAGRIPTLQKLYSITDEEIGTVGRERIADLVIERTALLNILK